MIDLTINPDLLLGFLIIIAVLLLVLITLLINNSRKVKTHDNSTFNEVQISINDELKSFGFAYDDKANFFYSILDPWQKDLGYCSLYDEAAPALSMIFDSEPIYFDYNGKHWLIEFWKGQYGITTGGEIGIYNTDDDGLIIPGFFNGRFYEAVEESEYIDMSFTLFSNNKSLIRQSGMHWWLTGFLLGELSHPNELKMHIKLNFPSKNMLIAFVNGLLDAGYTNSDFSTKNNTVYIIYDRPYTKQPFTRTELLTNFMQNNNSRNVELFNSSTNAFSNTREKLYYLRTKKPDYYKSTLEIGKPRQLYSAFNTIKKYLN